MTEPSVDPFTAVALAGLSARLDALEARCGEEAQLQTDRFFQTRDMLSRIFDREQDDRRRLAELRASADYERAFSEAAPLVSVVIPTLDRIDSLINVALPSVLRQTHPAVEVIVVGDRAEPEIGQAIAALGDPRVRFHNLTLRGPYSDDPLRAWMASGTPGFNAGIRMATGRWIVLFFDDDEMRPDAIQALIERARAERLEWVYGKVQMTTPEGTSELGSFPPRITARGLESPLQSSLFHAGLFFMELELGHSLFDMSNDVGLTRRMCLAGVRVGFLDHLVANFFPSMRNVELPVQTQIPGESSAESGLRAERDQLLGELAASVARESELVRRLETITDSRRWRWTETLLARVRDVSGNAAAPPR